MAADEKENLVGLGMLKALVTVGPKGIRPTVPKQQVK